LDDLRALVLLGGRENQAAGVSLSASLPPGLASTVRRALVSRAVVEAEVRGLRAAAMFVRDNELPDFRAGMLAADDGVVRLDQLATLSVPASFDDYLLALPSSRRSIVRRDLRDVRAIGLRTEVQSPDLLLRAASQLVVNIKTRHGIPDHPRLAELRLRRWSETCPGEHICFSVRDSEGVLVAVSFGCQLGKTLELNEIGLIERTGRLRHAAYLETLVYAPLRQAIAARCDTLLLGLGTPTPKNLRGAVLAPVWACLSPSPVAAGRVSVGQEAVPRFVVGSAEAAP
jgi:predicted N-acyltransferase